MNKAKKDYKRKIIRKYIELYLCDTDIIKVIDFLKNHNISFNSYVKKLIRQDIKENQNE